MTLVAKKPKSLRLERTIAVMNKVLDGIFEQGIHAADIEAAFESVLKSTNGIRLMHLQKIYAKINEAVKKNIEDEFEKMFYEESDFAQKLSYLEELVEEADALNDGCIKKPQIGRVNPASELRKTICDAKREQVKTLQEKMAALRAKNQILSAEYEQITKTDLEKVMSDIDSAFTPLESTLRDCLGVN